MVRNLRRIAGPPGLLILFLFCFTSSLFAQEHSYMHYDVNDGLAGSTVYCMAQDKDGFMWFGTETGLSRFDGTHFRNFTTSDGLPDNEILNMFVDSKNRVWLLPFKNTIAYYSKGSIHDQKNDSLLARLNITSNIFGVLEDSAGNILVREAKMIHIIHPGGKITDIKTFRGSPMQGVMQAGLDGRRGFRISFASMNGFIYADLDGDSLIEVRDIKVAHRNNTLNSYTDPHIQIYTNFSNLYFLDPLTGKDFNIRLPRGFIGISLINDSSLAINTYRNTLLFNMRQKKITDSFLRDQAVNSVMQDSEGSLWFCTLGKGVYRLGSLDIVNYSLRGLNKDLAAFCIKEFDSIIYIGSDHFFLWTLDLHNGKMHGRQVYEEVTRGRILAILKSNHSSDKVLGTDGGMFLLGSGKPIKISEETSIKSLSPIDDDLYLECSSFITRRVRWKDFTTLDTLWSARATCAQMQDGIGYVGTLNGLYAIDPPKNVIALGDRFAPLKSRISGIGESADGTLWVTTEGGGLVGYRAGKVVAHITEVQGLTSDICRNVFIAYGAVWVGTDKGLNKVAFYDTGYNITTYTRADGLNSDIVNAIYVKGNDIFVGTSEGITVFNDTKISKRSGCSLKITGISVSDRKWPFDTTGFILRHSDNNIQVEFAGISFKSSGSILYQYRLIGLDSAWKTTKENLLSYPSLPSGHYELQLFATNKFGVKSALTDIKFTIDKLLSERTWFRLLVLLSMALLVWLLFTYRLRSVRKKEAENTFTSTKMAELEQMALRSQMNPHFIFNCMNSIQEFVIDTDIRGANEFITKFSNLIRQTLEISSRPTISLCEEIKYISTYMDLENRRFGNKFVSSVVVSEGIDPNELFIPPMILQPYIENAIRHGIGHRQDKKGRIGVRIDLCKDRVLCIIEDNGVGRRRAALYKGANGINYQSMGMNLVARRLDMLNKTNKTPILIEIEDLEDPGTGPSGTRITLSFPLEQATQQTLN